MDNVFCGDVGEVAGQTVHQGGGHLCAKTACQDVSSGVRDYMNALVSILSHI